jgi:two-component sensor histidine kinase
MSYAAAGSNRTRFPVGSVAEGIRLKVQPAPRTDSPRDAESNAELDLRQLRHHTKNTLQRLIGLIGETSGLRDTPEGEQLARELENRICLSASISNALFGLTGAPAPMVQRLRDLAGAVVELLSADGQRIRIGVSVRGCCPNHLREAAIRSAHELIGNAVKHGMKGRPSGRIAVRLVSDARATTLTITDDGWGFRGIPREGEGLALARSFADMHGGKFAVESADGTVAMLEWPNWD